MKKAFWLAVVLLGLMAMPSSAIFLSCDELCTCVSPCSKLCRFTPTSPYTNCGAIGVCVGGFDCTGAATTASASAELAAIFSPAVCTEGPSDTQPAATDSASPVVAPAPAAD